jgi:transcriptional regulator with XRE-family HTH domain
MFDGKYAPTMHDALNTPEGLRALAGRDITIVYRLLNEAGVRQRDIAAMAGQGQSEVSEILKGRQVMGYDVLVKIAEGLDIPRGLMGLAYDEDLLPLLGEEADEDMKRRALLASGSIALFDRPVIGKLLDLPKRPDAPTPLPSRLGISDVEAVKALISELRGLARTYGGCADTVTAIASRSLQLMAIPGSEEVHVSLASALADLHTMAGWCCVDSGLHDNARACFGMAMTLAPHDGYQFALALRHAGIHMRDAGAYNDNLKACQLGLIKIGGSPDTPEIAEAVAWLTAESGVAYAAMGHRFEAEKALRIAREHRLSNTFDEADMDYAAAEAYHRLGRLDIAEGFAASSFQKWPATSHRDSVLSDIVLATIHVQSGEQDSPMLAHRAIKSVASVRSARARINVSGLIEALESRPKAEYRELAVLARRVMGQKPSKNV